MTPTKRMIPFVLMLLMALGWSWTACDSGVGTTEPGQESQGESQRSEGITSDQQETTAPDEPLSQPEPTTEPTSPEPGSEPTADAGSPDQSTAPDTATPDDVTNDSATPDTPQGAPIQAPARKWHWVDVPGSYCGYGGQTGFGINLNPGAKRAFIYFQGGGACWKEKVGIGSCFDGVPTSFNLKGFTKKTFEQDLVTRQNLGAAIFSRKDADNVFLNDHMVFIPYCTGDVHSGQKVVKFSKDKTMHFVGHNNLKAFLARLVPTFKGVEQVVISGSSAGGFGAALNWWTVQKAFGDKVRVDLIDDSGPPIEPADGRWEEWHKTWDVALPPGCTGCDKKISALMEYYKNTLLKQGRRMGLLTYDRDAIIRNFFGINNLLGQEFKKRIDALFDEMDKVPNAHYFALGGSSHTLLILTPKLLRSKDGVKLMRWVEWLVEGNSAWKSHRP